MKKAGGYLPKRAFTGERSISAAGGGSLVFLLYLSVGLPALIKGKVLEMSLPYFSCRLSQRALCGPGSHFCTAAFRRAPSRQAGASHRCPPASWTWRRSSHTGCPRAPRKTSVAPPRRYGNRKCKNQRGALLVSHVLLAT